MRRGLVFLPALLVLGCEPDPLDMQMFVDFPPDLPRAAVQRLTVRVVQGTCVDAEADLTGMNRVFVGTFALDAGEIVVPEGVMPRLLASGPHCFSVTATTTDCTLAGSGSQEAELPASSVTIALVATVVEPMSEPICGCPAARCLPDGSCDGEEGLACPCDAPPRETECADDRDEDCDGRADCRDEDCDGMHPTNEAGRCDNEFDDDCDDLVDCDDPDCRDVPLCECLASGTCATDEMGRPVPPMETGACSNDRDDDGDGLINCADSDCRSAYCGEGRFCKDCGARGWLCAPQDETLCGNDVDDDCDGGADCMDADDDCLNRLCGSAYDRWVTGQPWGMMRCCNQACQWMGADIPAMMLDNPNDSCGSCGRLCPGGTECMKVHPHTSMRHQDIYTCGGCTNDRDCGDPDLWRCADTAEGRRCFCRTDAACGAHQQCSAGPNAHCHPDLGPFPG